MPKIVLTSDEIVSYIKKSTLTNILVEGPTDLMVYNWIESKFNRIDVVIFPCGGRSTLIEVYKRRAEFPDKKVAYLADKDLLVFAGIPHEYSDIIFTSGYSIENDLYSYGKNVIYSLFSELERRNFEETIENIVIWYCSEILKFLNNEEHHISFHLNQVIPENSTSIDPDYKARIKTIMPTQTFIDDIKAGNLLKLRGKFIFDCTARYLSYTSRKSKFSRENIMELCLKTSRNMHFERIVAELSLKIA